MAKKAPKTEGTEGEAAPVTTITLSDICKEMDIKPQSARIKLRKKLTGSKEAGFRWVFPIEKKEEIMALLTPAPKADPEAPAEGDDEGEGDDE